MNILLTVWKSLHFGLMGSGIFIMICSRLACVSLSVNSRVTISQMEHVSICMRNWAWCNWRLVASALAWILVNRQWSQTNRILNPSGNIVALEEYKYSIWLLIVIWCTLSISMCNALIEAALVLLSFFVPSLIAQNLKATFTPVKLQISWLNASWLYSSVENSSQLAHKVSSANCRSVHHMPCLVDLSHHPIVSIISARLIAIPSRTWTWYAPPVVQRNSLCTNFFSSSRAIGILVVFSMSSPSSSLTRLVQGYMIACRSTSHSFRNHLQKAWWNNLTWFLPLHTHVQVHWPAPDNNINVAPVKTMLQDMIFASRWQQEKTKLNYSIKPSANGF